MKFFDFKIRPLERQKLRKAGTRFFFNIGKKVPEDISQMRGSDDGPKGPQNVFSSQRKRFPKASEVWRRRWRRNGYPYGRKWRRSNPKGDNPYNYFQALNF